MISARNQIRGNVSEIREGAVNGIVKLEASGGVRVSATISMEAIRELGLVPGSEATAVVKATEVMIGTGELKLSARNQFPGKIISVEPGTVNGIVRMEALEGRVISATISMAAVDELGLEEGTDAVAVIKASSVLIGR